MLSEQKTLLTPTIDPLRSRLKTTRRVRLSRPGPNPTRRPMSRTPFHPSHEGWGQEGVRDVPGPTHRTLTGSVGVLDSLGSDRVPVYETPRGVGTTQMYTSRPPRTVFPSFSRRPLSGRLRCPGINKWWTSLEHSRCLWESGHLSHPPTSRVRVVGRDTTIEEPEGLTGNRQLFPVTT